MPSLKSGRHILLVPVNGNIVQSNASTSDDSDGDGEDTEERTSLMHKSQQQQQQKRCKLKSNLLGSKRKRNFYYLHRGVRRIVRYLLFAITVSMFMFLLLYLPVNSGGPNRYAALPDWTYNTSRNVADYVLPLKETILIAPTDMCKEKVFVIIVVSSGLHNFVQRQTIRETWGNNTEFNYNAFQKLHAHLNGKYLQPTKERLHYYSDFLSQTISKNSTLMMSIKVRIVFLVGRSKYESLMGNETLTRLHNEAEQYNDIIQENFIDTYNNLTIKSVLALKYLAKNCLNQSAYFMKCDEDTFVNIPNLLHYLLGGTIPLYNATLAFYNQITYEVMSPRNRLQETSGLLIGHLFCSARPVNDVSSKWYMPSYMYPRESYPSYLSGAGYIMSMDVVQRLYDIALNTSLIYLEDVYLTGICGQAAHLKRRHQALFSYTRSKNWCTFKGIITQHELKDESMVEAWQFVSNYKKNCPPPDKYFKQMHLRKRHNC